MIQEKLRFNLNMVRSPGDRQRKSTALSKFLQQKMDENGIEQAELGRRARVSSGHMTNIMRHGAIPGPDIVRALAEGLGVDPDTTLEVAGYIHPTDVPESMLAETKDFIRRLYRLPPDARKHVMNVAYLILREEEKRLPQPDQ